MTFLFQPSFGRVVAGLSVAFILVFDPSPRADAASNPPLSELSDQRGQPNRNRPGPRANDARPEVWLCAGERITDLLRPEAEWPSVRQHLSGIKLYVDQINKAAPEQLAALVRLAKDHRYQIAVELGGCLDFAPMDDRAGEWSARHELAKIEKFYAAGGQVDFLDIDGPIRRLMHPENRRDRQRFDSIEKAADELVDALRLHQQAHPKTRFWLLSNFPNWGYQGDVSYHARGPKRQDYGDDDEAVRVVLRKLRAAEIPLAGVTVDNPYDYLMGEHSSVNLKDPKSVDWLQRVRRYEDFAREKGLEFNLIVNSERGGHASDELFYRETLQMVDIYRKAGGHPTRWFVQSWYPYPKQIVPETAPHSMTALVKAVIERVSDRPVAQSRTGLPARSHAEPPDRPPPVTADGKLLGPPLQIESRGVDGLYPDDVFDVVIRESSTTRVTSTGAEPPLADRISTRTFPSVFQAWNAAESVDDPSPLHTVARHDLVFHAPEFFGLRWNHGHTGLADGFSPESIEAARAFRQKLLELNPRLVLLTEIRYRDAPRGYLPEGHSWWLRDAEGHLVSGWEEGGFLCLNFHDPEYRSQVVKQAKAAVDSGAVDGVMLDWWSDDASRLALVKELRQAVGDDALIMANSNDLTTPQTAPYLNGYFMECYKSQTAQDWKQIADTLAWAEENLRPPRVNCLETWFHKSREDLDLMRATTTLALTHSDGYCLFSDPNPLPKRDHLHNWYPFWNKRLGRPTAKGQKLSDGTHRREFEQGTVVYNPMGNQPVRVTFAQPQISLATGKTGLVHRLGSPDGDIYLSTASSGRIALQPQPGAMQVTARVPALDNQAFALGVPETIGCREAMLVNFPEARIEWQGPDREGVVSCSWGPGGRIFYLLRLIPAEDYVDLEMTIHNHTEFLWHDVFAFNCLNPIQAPVFKDWKLERTYMSSRGQPLRMAQTTRVKGHMPTVGFYLPDRVRVGQESVFVRGFGATSPDRTDGSWIVTLSEPAGAYMAATAMKAAFLFDNLDRCCIHAAPGFGDIGPGEASTTVSRLYLAKGTLDIFLKRQEADRPAVAARQKWARAVEPASDSKGSRGSAPAGGSQAAEEPRPHGRMEEMSPDELEKVLKPRTAASRELGDTLVADIVSRLARQIEDALNGIVRQAKP